MKNQINYKLQITNYSLTTNILTSRIPLTRTERSRSVGGFRGGFIRQAIIALFLIANILFLKSTAQAQNVGINTSVPDASAIMDITHTNRGLLIPRIALTATNVAAPITAPALSLLVFNTNTTVGVNGVKPGYYYWDGAKWVTIGGGNAWELLGNTGTTAGTNFIGTTDNVSLRFRTNNIENMIIDSVGNAGLGTSAPNVSGSFVGASIFSVSGKSSSPNNVSNGRIELINPLPAGGLTSGATFAGLLMGCISNNGAGIGSSDPVIGSIGFVLDGAGGVNGYGGKLILATKADNGVNTNQMFLLSNGNVGIGTPTPTRKLDINGDGINIVNTANTVIDMQGSSGHLFRTQADAGSYGIYDITSFPFVPRISIANNGNVGLNNAAPANNTLEITQGTAGNSGLRFTNLLNAGVLGTDANGDVINTTTPNPSNALFWGITGNSGTNSATNFIGTTDNVDLVFKVNNIQSGLLNNSLKNTSFGYGAFLANTTGFWNTVLGASALASNTSGNYNVALGDNALVFNISGNQNTATGVNSFRFNTTGSNNVANGYTSLFNNTIGNQNTAVGTATGITNISGNNNTFLGYGADVLNTNLTNSSAIGYEAKVSTSNSMVLGGTGADAVNVGIGLTNPTSRIHIFSVGSADIRNVADGGYSGTQSWTYNSSNIGHPYFIGFAARGLQSSPTYPLAGDVLSAYIGRDAIDGSTAPIAYGGADMYIKTTENHSVTNKGTRIIFSTTPNTTAIVQERMYIDHSGNVGIGIGSPVAKLQILGTTANNTDAMIGGTFSPTKVYLNSLGDAAIGAPLFNYRGFMGFNVSYDATSNRFVSDHDGGSSNPGSAIFHHSSGSLFFANLPSTSGTLPQQNTTTDLLNNTTMVLTAAHNVGIGTASPGDKLSVVGRGEFVTTIADHGVRVKGDGTDAQAILQYTNNAGTVQWANITGTPIGGGQLVFSTQFTPRMTLGQDGQLTNPGFSNPISADGQGNSIASLGWTTGNGALTASFYNSSAAPFAEGVLVKVAGSAYNNILFEASTGAPNVASTTPALIVRGNGSVGIGTATPNVGAKLDVAGSAFFANQKGYLAYYNPPGFDQFEVAAIGPATSLSLVTNGVSKLNITPAGQVGIGTITPTELLSVNGGANNLTGVWTIFSDERIKTVKDEFTDGLNVINQIRPVRFTYNTDAPFTSTDTQIGIVAQELEKIAPYMVTKQDFNGIKDLREVNGQAYTFLFINAIKEQQAQIEELKKEIEMLKKK